MRQACPAVEPGCRFRSAEPKAGSPTPAPAGLGDARKQNLLCLWLPPLLRCYPLRTLNPTPGRSCSRGDGAGGSCQCQDQERKGKRKPRHPSPAPTGRLPRAGWNAGRGPGELVPGRRPHLERVIWTFKLTGQMSTST